MNDVFRGSRSRDDQGFTLVELIVAIGMATAILTAFAYASISSLRAMHTARLNQQGADIVTQHMEQVRNLAYGSLGHDAGAVSGDANLSSCAGGYCYNGEPLVVVAGGQVQQEDAVASNTFDYTLHTYVTRPTNTGGADYRRVTVVAEWEAYGKTWTKAMSTIVTQTQRGLPLPEFKLVAISPSSIIVNPNATAAFGFQLTNQGAPDQWNLTVANLPDYTLVMDNGDRIYNADQDTTAMSDHNADGIPDTGRLDPKSSVVFWVVFTATVDRTFTVTAQAISQTGGVGAQVVQSRVTVQSGVITSSPTPSGSPSASASPTSVLCTAPGPGPVPSAVPGYSRKSYVLHNSGTTAWPTFPLPATGAIPGSTAMTLMYLDMNPPSIPIDRDLPDYSTNLSAGMGRLLNTGGSYSSTSPSTMLDFRTQNPNRSYTGKMILRLWVKPASGDGDVELAVQAYKRKTNGNQAQSTVGSTVDLVVSDTDGCEEFREATAEISISSFAAGSNNVIGFKVWNKGGAAARIAYDHEAFPATFTVVEK